MAVDTKHPDYVTNTALWQRMRDCVAGHEAMQLRASDYIRKPEGAGPTQFAEYCRSAVFFEATGRTLEGLTGMAFARDPTITVPSGMQDFVDDCTQDGVPLQQFADSCYEQLLTVSRVGIMCDYPPPDPNIRNRRDEELANRRPFLRRYDAESILNWETTKVNGVYVLSQVRLWEIEYRDVAEFEREHRQIIRVLDLTTIDGRTAYRQRVFAHKDWIKVDGSVAETVAPAATPARGRAAKRVPAEPELDVQNWSQDGGDIVPKIDGKPLNFIPFWIVNPSDQTPGVRRPLLAGLANANVNHFNTTAQLENVMFWCGNPQPYATGVEGTNMPTLEVGTSNLWTFPDAQTKVDFLTADADSIGALEKRLDRIEQQMALLGARMLSPDKRAAEAAETARIHRQGEMSVVTGTSNSLSRALTDIIKVAEMFQRVSGETLFKMDTSFFDELLTISDAKGLIYIWQQGFMAPSDVLYSMKKGELIRQDRTLEEIQSENESSPLQPIMPGLTPGSGGIPLGQPAPKPTPAPTPTPAPAPKK